MYHTKLEQLTTLTNRVAALARILGQDFYPADILEPTFSPGESEEQLDPRRDVTPERFSKLEKELVRGKGEVVSILCCTIKNMNPITCMRHLEQTVAASSRDDDTNRLAVHRARYRTAAR